MRACKREGEKEREREREGRKREEERGRRPTRAERGERKDMVMTACVLCPAWTGTGSPVSCRQTTHRRRRDTQAGHQKRRRRTRRRRERRARKHRNPERSDPTEKPAAFSAPKPSQNTIPQQECQAPKIVPINCRSSPHKTPYAKVEEL